VRAEILKGPSGARAGCIRRHFRVSLMRASGHHAAQHKTPPGHWLYVESERAKGGRPSQNSNGGMGSVRFGRPSRNDRYLRIPAVHYSVIRMSESLIAVPRSRPERTDSNSGPSRLMPGSTGGDLRIEEDGLGLPLLIKGAILSRHR
jgi:hypothetical protein